MTDDHVTHWHGHITSLQLWYGLGCFLGFGAPGLILVGVYGEYEPKFGPWFNVGGTLIGAFLIAAWTTLGMIVSHVLAGTVHQIASSPSAAAPLGFCTGVFTAVVADDLVLVLTLAAVAASACGISLALWNQSRRTPLILLACLTLGAAMVSQTQYYRVWYAKKCVKYVLWSNFHHHVQFRKPHPSLESLNQPWFRRWLWGIGDLHEDPWGNPFHYQLLSANEEHPHTRTGVNRYYAFWSDGPNGRDDEGGRDDIDETKIGLY